MRLVGLRRKYNWRTATKQKCLVFAIFTISCVMVGKLFIAGNSASSFSGPGSPCVLPQLQNIWQPVAQLNCSTSEPNWVYTKAGKVFISDAAVRKHGAIFCDIIPILRLTNDVAVSYGKVYEVLVNNSYVKSDWFQVNCTSSSGKSFNMTLSGITPKSAVHVTQSESKTESGLGVDVMMLGFDSVSRMNWIRNLPLSYDYFTATLGAVVLKGYNIVGDGTPQALLPILTGQTETELPEARRGKRGARPLDDAPFIWKDFKQHGYYTQFGEDKAMYGTFTYRLLGFRQQPVDHYMRPYFLAYEKENLNYEKYCMGSLPNHVNMFNWMRDFVDVYRAKRKFAFNFHNELSHDHYLELQKADVDLLEFLQNLFEDGHLANTILILMSDHGARFKELRNTEQGKLEERLPFVGIYIPRRLRQSNPEILLNLLKNAKRLTTPFDVHETFLDILHYPREPEHGFQSKRGISLFREIPANRSCLAASIEPHWCSCLQWQEVDADSQSATFAAQAVIDTINQATAAHRKLCVHRSLLSVIKSLRYEPDDSMLKFLGSKDSDGRIPTFGSETPTRSRILFQVKLVAAPARSVYEATVWFTPTKGLHRSSLSDISRLDAYGNQSSCIASEFPHLRQFCACYDSMDATISI